MTSDVRIVPHRYKYFPYERVLAEREAISLLGPRRCWWDDDVLVAEDSARPEAAVGLTYASKFDCGSGEIPTTQSLIEHAASGSGRRQVTRYASHGLHEYKGKFNPQIVRFILNFYGMEPGKTVLDPFTGSGTSLVEASLMGVSSVGIDANPASSMLASTKVALLQGDLAAIGRSVTGAFESASNDPKLVFGGSDPRIDYLLSWFPYETLDLLERVRLRLKRRGKLAQRVGLLVISNYLREYSFQEPMDLRVRRRSDAPSINSLLPKASEHLGKVLRDVSATIGVVGSDPINSGACNVVRGDSSSLSVLQSALGGASPDLVVSSPPYAMALPYIDTQRLSLVWLGLLDPSEIRVSGEQQIGNREVSRKRIETLNQAIVSNPDGLAPSVRSLCVEMLGCLGSKDGFRRQAVPALSFQYFTQMEQMFRAVRLNTKEGTPFALVVGRNRTTLGGREFAIDTPRLLADVAQRSGWDLQDSISLEAYQRYGLHAANAISSEELLLMRAS